MQIRSGTETLAIYEKGHDDDQNYVRYQASLTKLARECHYAGSALLIKVGIAGRLAAGPLGKPGNFALPLRVAIVKQADNNIFYSDVTKVPVTISAPTYASDFTTVVDNISFEVGPQDHDLIIYVGYDEGKPEAQDADAHGLTPAVLSLRGCLPLSAVILRRRAAPTEGPSFGMNRHRFAWLTGPPGRGLRPRRRMTA